MSLAVQRGEEEFSRMRAKRQEHAAGGLQAIIVAPSRELAMQIVRVGQSLLPDAARGCVQQAIGGANPHRQVPFFPTFPNQSIMLLLGSSHIGKYGPSICKIVLVELSFGTILASGNKAKQLAGRCKSSPAWCHSHSELSVHDAATSAYQIYSCYSHIVRLSEAEPRPLNNWEQNLSEPSGQGCRSFSQGQFV